MQLKPTKTGDVKVDKALDELRDALGKPATPIRNLTWGANDLGTTTAQRWLYPGYESAIAFIAERGAHIVTSDGRLRNMYAWHYDEGIDAATISYVIRVNGKDTPLSVNVPNTSTGVFTSRNNSEVPVKAGDLVTCVVRKSAAITQSTITAIVAVELV